MPHWFGARLAFAGNTGAPWPAPRRRATFWVSDRSWHEVSRMNFLAAVLTCLRKYARFSGRASRGEYWNFGLCVVCVSGVLAFLDRRCFPGQVVIRVKGLKIETSGPLSGLFGFAVLLPLLAAGWRRMHDTGRSGIHLLYPLIVMLGISMFLGFLTGYGPLLSGELWEIVGKLGAILLVVALFVLAISPMIVVWWLTRPGQAGDNRYGVRPLLRGWSGKAPK